MKYVLSVLSLSTCFKYSITKLAIPFLSLFEFVDHVHSWKCFSFSTKNHFTSLYSRYTSIVQSNPILNTCAAINCICWIISHIFCHPLLEIVNMREGYGILWWCGSHLWLNYIFNFNSYWSICSILYLLMAKQQMYRYNLDETLDMQEEGKKI